MENDIVGCKNICGNQENKRASADTLSKSLDSMTLAKTRNAAVCEDDTQVDFVHVLPVEMIEEIFMYLTPKDLAACASVSSAWRDKVNSNKVWRVLAKKKGWKDDFDQHISNFHKSHKQFRVPAHSSSSLSPICHQRLLFSKHSELQKNWRRGKYIIHEISTGGASGFQLIEPVACDGRYLVVQEKISGFSPTLAVWRLDGSPHQVCTLPLPSNDHSVESIAFDHGTIAVAQARIILVYHLKDNSFVQVFEKRDLADLEPKTRLPNDVKQMAPHLGVTQEYIICVPNHSHIPIFFWDKESGELKHTLNFDSMYYQISNAVWFKDSCYLSLTDEKKKSYQVVEFGVKSAAWKAFSQSVTVNVEQVVVGEQYVLAVTNKANFQYRVYFINNEINNRELWLWDRATGSAIRTFEAQGKGFQFVDDYLMYFDSTKFTVMNPKAPDMCTEFELLYTISSIRPAQHPSSTIVIIKNSSYIEVWDWAQRIRLYTIGMTHMTRYDSQLWCDDKRIIIYYSSERRAGDEIWVFGFW